MPKSFAFFFVLLFTLLAGPSADAALIHYAETPVPGSYLVEVASSVESGAELSAFAAELASKTGGVLGSVYDDAFRGFVLDGVSATAVAKFSRDGRIARVIQNERYENVLSESAPYCYFGPQLDDNRPVPGISTSTVQVLDCADPATGSGGDVCIDNWGLDRIGEESLPTDLRYRWADNASGRRVYVFDSGIRASHREFERFLGLSRVEHIFNATNEPDGDSVGHGTHVAGIAAGRTFGVAKWASIYDVQVFDDIGATQLDWLIDGFAAIDGHLSLQPTDGVAAMSWSANFDGWVSGTSKQLQLLRQQLRQLLENHPNLLLVQSAGNQGENACDWSFGDDALFPTVADQIVVAGGSDPSDSRFLTGPQGVESNFGDCVDLFSPAAVVFSAWNTDDNDVCQLTGTSMAAPHVSGAALVLSELFPQENAAGIRNLLVGTATEGALDEATIGQDSPNLLLSLQAVDAVIFDDDFPGLGHWDLQVATGPGSNSTCSGYCPSLGSAFDTAYLGDTSPSSETIYRGAFQLNHGGLTFGSNSRTTIFRARGAGDATLFELILETGSPGFAPQEPVLKVVVQTNTGPVEQSVALPAAGSLIDPTLQLEFEWVPSALDASTGSPEGFFRLWSGHVVLDDIDLALALDDLDTFGMEVESALLGLVESFGTVSGSAAFAEFRSRREDRAITFLAHIDNEAPQPQDDFLSTLWETPLGFTHADLLANDTDPDGDPLTVCVIQQPTHGTISSNGPGDLTYTPPQGCAVGLDSFQYAACDDYDETLATVNVSISGFICPTSK